MRKIKNWRNSRKTHHAEAIQFLHEFLYFIVVVNLHTIRKWNRIFYLSMKLSGDIPRNPLTDALPHSLRNVAADCCQMRSTASG